jgi:hypothetical protein
MLLYINMALVYPLGIAYWRSGIHTIFNCFTSDTFYYLSIAKNSSFLRFSFDGTTITNGFHPLWGFLLGLIPNGLLVGGAFILSGILVVAGYNLLAVASWRLTKSALPGLFLVPGAYYLVYPHMAMDAPAGTPWSYMNGMETPLSIFLFGCLLFQLTSEYRHYISLGLTLALMVLARLDDVFLPFTIALCFLIAHRTANPNPRRLLSIVLPSVLALGAYMLFNSFTFGHPMPVSFLAKSGSGLPANFYLLKACLTSVIWGQAWVDPLEPHDHSLNWILWRVLQLILPALVAAGFLILRSTPRIGPMVVSRLRATASHLDIWFAGVAMYILMKAAYTFSQTRFDHVGSWYFPISVIFANFCVAIGIHALIMRVAITRERAFSVFLALVYIVVVLALIMPDISSELGRPNAYANFWINRATHQSTLDSQNVTKVLEYDDGIVNFSTTVQAISGWNFAIDLQTLRARQDGKFFGHLYAQGVDTIASYHYARRRLPDPADDETIRKWLQYLLSLQNTPQDMEDFVFKPIACDAGFTLVRFLPRSKED